MRGYCSTGSRRTATMPKSTVSTAMTLAVMGRLRKKRVNMKASKTGRPGDRDTRRKSALPFLLVSRSSGLPLRLHRRPRPGPLQSADDDPFAAGEALLDNDQPVFGRHAGLDRALLDRVLAIDHHH